MATVPTVPTFGPNIAPATALGQLADAVRFSLAPPHAVLRQTSAQTIGTGSFTALNFDTEDVDSVNGHDSGLPSRYTAVYPGWYQVSGGATFASSATGRRLARVGVNGALVAGSESGVPGNASVIGFAFRATEVYLAIGDYVEVFVFQDSGGNLATFVANAEFQCSMAVRWVSN